MAVAAYAALLSLSHVLENVQLPARRSRLHLDTQQLQSPQEKVEFLRDFLELHSQKRSQEMEDLGRQISIVADEAEDIIDFHVVYQLCEGSNDHKSDPVAALSSFCQDIDRVVEKIDSIMKGLMKMEEEWGYVLEQKPVASLLPSSSTPLVSGKNTMLGFDEYLVQIMDELTRDDSDLRILPIVGMGGIVQRKYRTKRPRPSSLLQNYIKSLNFEKGSNSSSRSRYVNAPTTTTTDSAGSPTWII